MALSFLRLPSSPHPHLSLPFSKPRSSPFALSLFPPSKPCTHLKAGPQSSHLFPQPFTRLTTRTRCSPAATETVAAEDEEGAKESVEVYDRRRLYVQNIPWTCTVEDIRALFEKHGTVIDVEVFSLAFLSAFEMFCGAFCLLG